MDTFMHWLIANSIKSAVLIATVFLVQFIFSKQIPPKWKYLMWMLVAIRLVMPVMFESDTSIFNLKKCGRRKRLILSRQLLLSQFKQ